MSLIKQLWIGIALLMVLAFSGSAMVSTLSAKSYLEEQLQLKDSDNATALALSMSQMEKDLVTLELLIAAQFDAGHYQFIRLLDPTGDTLVSRTFDGETSVSAPNWFAGLIPIHTRPASAVIQDGWGQFGRIELQSHTGYAIDSLWQGTVRLLQWFAAMGLVAGVAGTVLIRTIAKPLNVVVAQAEALGDRRFTLSNEPRTREFRQLVSAMNRLTGRIRDMLDKEARQLDTLRRRLQQDELTGLLNREHFMHAFTELLGTESHSGGGTLILVRVMHLQSLNQTLGRNTADALLQSMGSVLTSLRDDRGGAAAGRLNGTDFALVIPGRYDASTAVEELREALVALRGDDPDSDIQLPVAVDHFDETAERAAIMVQVDGALAQAEQSGQAIAVFEASTSERDRPPHQSLDDWRDVLVPALNDGSVQTADYPVVALDSSDIVQIEHSARMVVDGEVRPASYFVPWLARLDLLPALDLEVLRAVLKRLHGEAAAGDHARHAINLSADTLGDPLAQSDVLALLDQAPQSCSRLAFEFPEFSAMRSAETFSVFCRQLRSRGCQVGLEHCGADFTHLDSLHDLGLDYIKLDPTQFAGIATDPTQQQFIRGLCTLGHSLGITMIAQGIRSNDVLPALADTGIDAATGPGIPG